MAEQFKQFHKSSRYTWYVSDHGNIHTVTSTGKVRQRKTFEIGGHRTKYQAISINSAPEKYVHRIVAMAFIDNPNNLPTINHKDGNKDNNHVSNLEWSTHSDNLKHAYRVLDREPSTGPKRGLRNITFQDAEDIRELYASGSWSYNALGRQYGLYAPSIKSIILGKTYREM